LKQLLIMLFCAVIAAGCARKAPDAEEPAVSSEATPKWLSYAGQSFSEDKGNTLYGVGVGEKLRMPDSYVRKKDAEERARLEIMAALRNLSRTILTRYADAAFVQDEEQNRKVISDIQQELISQSSEGIEIKEGWIDPKTGDVYALAKLDFGEFLHKLRGKAVSAEKQKLRVPEEEAHKRLDELIKRAIEMGEAFSPPSASLRR
jgi:hypothetical protein